MKATLATAVAAGAAAAFLMLGGPKPTEPQSVPTKPQTIKRDKQAAAAMISEPEIHGVGTALAARLLFRQHGEPLYAYTVTALLTDPVAIGQRHPAPDTHAHSGDMITCRDGMIAADAAINIMAVSYAYNLLVQHKVAPYYGEEQLMSYYPYGEDIDLLGKQLMHLRVACKNILPGAGYVPEFDIMNNTGAEVRGYVSVALEEMGHHLGDLSDSIAQKNVQHAPGDLSFCKPMHEVAAALRPAMRDRPTAYQNKQHAENFDYFYAALKGVCPQYGPIY